MGTSLLDGIKSHASTAVGVGILLIVAGVVAICAPFAAGLSVMVMIGAVTIIGGVAQCVLAFRMGTFGRGLVGFLLGLLMIVAGSYVFTEPAEALGSMTLLLAIYFFVSGLMELFAALSARHAEGWGWMAFNGVITLILGMMIWRQFPVSGIWAVGTLFGVKLMLSGWSLFAIGSAVRRGVKGVQAALR
jgi:uncharacterized membrane protein HdeD (DUF308 family)